MQVTKADGPAAGPEDRGRGAAATATQPRDQAS